MAGLIFVKPPYKRFGPPQETAVFFPFDNTEIYSVISRKELPSPVSHSGCKDVSPDGLSLAILTSSSFQKSIQTPLKTIGIHFNVILILP